MQREVVAQWLDGFQRRMDDVVDVATREIQSVSGSEDSLVFLLGVLNLATLLCYAVHSQLSSAGSESGSESGSDADQFLYRKIQSVLDDLVLHVHTRTYYRNILQQDHERGFSSARSAKMDSAGRMDDVMTPTAIRHRTDYQRFIKQRSVKLIRQWISVFRPEADSGSRKKRETRRRLRTNAGRRAQNLPVRMNSTFIQRRRYPVTETPPESGSIALPIGGGRGGTHWRLGPIQRQNRPTEAPILPQLPISTARSAIPEAEKRSIAWNPSGSSNRVSAAIVPERNPHPPIRNQIPRNEAPDLRIPALPALPPLPAGIRQLSSNDTLTTLMAMVSQASTLTLDVLDVFRNRDASSASGDAYSASGDAKCLERLLCQLNQDWRSKSVATAAFAPFLSISLGWMLDGSENAEFPHVLMAVRAGWMGKRCTTLYPRCKRPDFRNPAPATTTTTPAPTTTTTTTTTTTRNLIIHSPPDVIRKKTDVLLSQENYDSVESSSSIPDSGMWGKPSRLSVADEVQLDDIRRGIYQLNQTIYQQDDETEEEEEDEEDEEEEEDDESSEEEDDEEYDEEEESEEEPDQTPIINAVKTERLMLMPHSEGFSWAAASPTSAASAASAASSALNEEENQLKADGLRRRDRTPFTHADAVKDDRFNEMIMLYLRDRSAK